MKVKRFLLFTLVLCIALFTFSEAQAARCTWFTFGASGYLDSDDHAFGTTSGQVAVGVLDRESTVGQGTIGYWYNQIIPELCLEIDIDLWRMDSINVAETMSMILGEEIAVNNCGNCNLNYGLRFEETGPIIWSIGYSNYFDRFVTRGRFTDIPEPPAVFEPTRDFIRDATTWAHGTSFGEHGFNVSPSSVRYLWLQFLSPVGSSEYGDNTITISLHSQANLP